MTAFKRLEIAGGSQVDYLADEIVRSSTVPYFSHGRDYRSDLHCGIGGKKVFVWGNVKKPKGLEVDYDGIARDVVENSGYLETGDIDNDFKIDTSAIGIQRVDIANRLNDKGGVGDSGHGSGWATNETPYGVSKATVISRELASLLNDTIHDNGYEKLGPDLKTNFVFSYNGNNELIGLLDADIAIQHRDGYQNGDIKELVWDGIIKPYLDKEGIKYDADLVSVNNGLFVTGGPISDGGHSNARIAFQAYGEQNLIPFQESFWGRSPEKDSVVWPLWARWVAKNFVSAGLADECTVDYSCSIGRPEVKHISISGVHEMDPETAIIFAKKIFGYTVDDVIEKMDLNNPKNYPKELITRGIFGSDLDVPWERVILK